MKTNRSAGVFFAILAACIYGCTGILGKITYAEGSNTIMLAWCRSLFSIPVLYAVVRLRGASLAVTKKQLVSLFFLGLTGASLTSMFLYGAYNYISVGLTTCIHFIYPVLVALVCVTVFGEPISKTRFIAIGLSAVGLLLFLEKDLHLNMKGIVLAFLSAAAYAAYVIIMDKGGVRELHPMTISFYCCCVAAFVIGVYGLLTHRLTLDITAKGWFFMFLMAMFVSVGANSMIPVAVKNVGPTVTSILGMFEPISTVILGVLLLHERITLRGMLGSGLVISAVVLLTLENKNEAGE